MQAYFSRAATCYRAVMQPAAVDTRVRLDKATIIEAALRLLDEIGLDELSTRRLATELGVKGPSLYWHFKNMAELRDHMAEALLVREMPPPQADGPPETWREWMADGARGIRRAAFSCRDGARLFVSRRPTPERRARVMSANRTRLQAAGFSPEEAELAFLALGRYTLGWTLVEQMTEGASPESEAQFEAGLAALLDGLALRRR